MFMNHLEWKHFFCVVCVCVCSYVHTSIRTFLLLTVVDCGTLPNPSNGSVSHTAGTTVGQTATYSCNTGYNLVGDNNRTCGATGEWSGSEPTCERMLLFISSTTANLLTIVS